MKKSARWVSPVRVVVALVLGLLGAGLDVAAPFGDDSAPVTILYWLVAGAGLGFAWPRRPWLWAVLVGPWVGLVHLVIHAAGWPDSSQLTSVAAILPLIPVALILCGVGAYGGAVIRRQKVESELASWGD